MLISCIKKERKYPTKKIMRVPREIHSLFFDKPEYGKDTHLHASIKERAQRQKHAKETKEIQKQQEEDETEETKRQQKEDEEKKEDPPPTPQAQEPTHTNDIGILQWNLGKRKNSINKVIQWAKQNKIDIICLQECQNLGQIQIWLVEEGYNLYTHKDHPRVAMILNNTTAERRKMGPPWKHPKRDLMSITFQIDKDTLLQIFNGYVPSQDGDRSEKATTARTEMHMDILAQANKEKRTTHTIITLDSNETIEPKGRCQILRHGETRYPNLHSKRSPETSAMACYTETMTDIHRTVNSHLYETTQENLDETYTHVTRTRTTETQTNGQMTSKSRIDYTWASNSIAPRIQECEIVKETKEWCLHQPKISFTKTNQPQNKAPPKQPAELHKAIATYITWPNIWQGDNTPDTPHKLRGTTIPLGPNIHKLDKENNKLIAERVHNALAILDEKVQKIIDGKDETTKTNELTDLFENAAIKVANKTLGKRTSHQTDRTKLMEDEDKRWEDMVVRIKTTIRQEEDPKIENEGKWIQVKYGLPMPKTQNEWELWLTRKDDHRTTFQERRRTVHSTDWWATRNRKAFYKLTLKDFESTKISSILTKEGKIITDPRGIEREFTRFLHVLADNEESIQSDEDLEKEAEGEKWKRHSALIDTIMMANPTYAEVKEAVQGLGDVSASGRLAPSLLKAIITSTWTETRQKTEVEIAREKNIKAAQTTRTDIWDDNPKKRRERRPPRKSDNGKNM